MVAKRTPLGKKIPKGDRMNVLVRDSYGNLRI